ncbi:DUF1304 domain-containing protein [Chitinophaga qingshengii]|uniref:DUF1304 domain-containing protein n=1 Tax=Chitinophaga qingshengii TaxID=1569794 RepID=A0ABR7TVQ3_9BACT|nr:DUF1304 domain-containing protein [Chitinophaga qingshengii]MBC9933479.1 DUF1304 domain-containing protein [Chitinophaga qingshengii]
MLVLAKFLIAFVMLEHLYIMWFEMFAWTTKGPKIFQKFPKALFPATKPLAANQGLYNGFLAAGLCWSLLISDPEWARHTAVFFLGCVAVAGIYGALTAEKKIFLVQALPALVTLVLLHLA